MAAEYGLIGYPLTHSFSPAYFARKFKAEQIDATYTAFPLHDISAFPKLIEQHPFLHGLNVTIPYKEAIIPYLDAIDDVAKEIGAMNCISFKGGISKGYNTDVIGFEQSLLPLIEPYHTHALILGTGGASKAVAYVLQQHNISFRKVSSSNIELLNYSDLTPELIAHYKLIINTTPLGTFPHADTYPPIPYEALTSKHLLYDLVYNPTETKFLSLGKDRGAVIKNGFEMLELQADASWNIWKADQPTV